MGLGVLPAVVGAVLWYLVMYCIVLSCIVLDCSIVLYCIVFSRIMRIRNSDTDTDPDADIDTDTNPEPFRINPDRERNVGNGFRILPPPRPTNDTRKVEFWIGSDRGISCDFLLRSVNPGGRAREGRGGEAHSMAG